MQKTKRLLAIEKIIAEENISSHEMLIRKLKAKGIICTQATLSRNLKQLGAGRISDGKGGYKYSLPEHMVNAQSGNGRLQVLPAIPVMTRYWSFRATELRTTRYIHVWNL
jgi:transcriptional regulator of arginine metabolism